MKNIQTDNLQPFILDFLIQKLSVDPVPLAESVTFSATLSTSARTSLRTVRSLKTSQRRSKLQRSRRQQPRRTLRQLSQIQQHHNDVLSYIIKCCIVSKSIIILSNLETQLLLYLSFFSHQTPMYCLDKKCG